MAGSVTKLWRIMLPQSAGHLEAYSVGILEIYTTLCLFTYLSLNIPSLGRQRCLPSWGPRRTPWLFVISQLFDAVDDSNYVFWVSETIIQ